MHSCHCAQMLIVNVARQRILIYPAWLSQPFLSPRQSRIPYVHRTPWFEPSAHVGWTILNGWDSNGTLQRPRTRCSEWIWVDDRTEPRVDFAQTRSVATILQDAMHQKHRQEVPHQFWDSFRFKFFCRRRSYTCVVTVQDLVQPSMEAARRNPLRDYSDKAQISCVDLRVQGETRSICWGRAHKPRSLTSSVAVDFAVSQQRQIGSSIVFKERR